MCACRAGTVGPAQLQELWGPERDWAPLTGSTILRVEPRLLQLLQPSRTFGTPRDRLDPEADVQDRLLRLGQRLATQFEYFEIVALAHE